MAKRNWNPEQLAAIEDRGGDILVSAAAGSGKTSVLVERVMRLLTDSANPVAADRLLVVTFTNSAAAEMKTRISNALSELSAANPGNEFIRRQQLLMERAHISTIHSFCLEVIQENFSLLGIQPNSRICDDEEAALISSEALSEVIENRYKSKDADFLALSENISSEKDDGRIEDYILEFHKFLRALPHYESWLDDKLPMYDTKDFSAEKTAWGKIIFSSAKTMLEGRIHSIDGLSDVCSDAGTDAYDEMLEKDREIFENLISVLEHSDWNTSREAVLCAKGSFMRMPTVRNCEISDTVKGIREKYKNCIKEDLVKYFSSTEDEIKEDIEKLLPLIKCLFETTLEYDEAFTKKKSEKHILDFSDLEQLTLRVLTKPDGKGNYVPTEAAKIYSERFDYVLVDEFQDTNKVQDTIFKSISKGDNSFFVGDVKQSIYRFRQAMPELFLEKYNSWKILDLQNPDDIRKGEPKTIILGKNYRSRKNVTDGINFIFRQLMHSDCAEIEYGKNEELVPAASYPDDETVRNEFYLIDCGDEKPVQCEAEFVASKIYGMVKDKAPVSAGEGLRECNYSDFCIILRSMKGQSDIFFSALRKFGIPYSTKSGGGFLSQPEIIAVIDLLKTVDNPLLEIPLCGAMLSEIFAFTPDEISEIRLLDRNIPLYSAVKRAAENGDPKAENFIKTVELLRRYAAFESSDSVIYRLYSETLYPQMMLSSENGEYKLANLRLLVKYAADCEDSGYHGLSSFLRYIGKIEERGSDLESASTASDSGAVKIMSVHKSKGLEFPIVFLCGTGKKFNIENGSTTPYLNDELGLACPLRHSAYGVSYRTMPQTALGIKTRQLSLAEEMRILYVALTRAKENLIITCAKKNLQTELNKYRVMQRYTDRLDADAVLRAQGESDWLIPAFLSHPDCGILRDAVGITDSLVIKNGTKWKFGMVSYPEDIPDISAPDELPDKKAEADPSVLKQLSENVGWEYEFKASEHIPVKAGVSSLTHQGIHKKLLFSAKPSSGALSGAERGTALHTFMQFCDFEKAAESPSNEIKRLVDMKFITGKQAETISEEKVAAFFKSSLYERIKRSGFVRRELRFLQSLPAKELGYEDASPDDKITVQGVADCVFEENGKIVVVDYKTDYVENTDELSERYSAQLIMYEKLLEKALGKEVSGAVIWSFHFGKEIEI